MLVTDALVWGGLEAEGQNYFARNQSAQGIATYGRWQLGELHYNEGMDQQAVTERASAIIDGPPGLDPTNVQAGLRFPLWRVRLTWYAHDIPRVGGEPQHIRPGNIATILLYTMGEDATHPLPLFLPLLNMTVTFPQLAGGGESWVRYDGEFGISNSDSRFLWAYILKQQKKRFSPVVVVGAASNSSTSTSFGDFGTFTPNEAPDSTRTEFNFPFPMLRSTIEVYVNGLRWRENREYEVTGDSQITFYSALASDDQVYVEARTGTG